MPNAYKVNSATQSGSISKGNFQIGVENINFGPSAITDFYAGITPPTGGYAWYKSSGAGAHIRTAADDQTLVNIVNEEFQQGFTNVNQAINYINLNNNWLVMNRDYPTIPTSGLTLLTDYGFRPSYAPGTTAANSMGPYSTLRAFEYNANGATFSNVDGGGLLYDGIDDVSFFDDAGTSPFGVQLYAAFTAIHIFKSTDANWFGNGGGLNSLYNDGSGFIIYPVSGTKQIRFFVGSNTSHFAVNVGTHTATNIQTPMFFAVSSNGSNSHKGYFGGTASVYTNTSSITRVNTYHEIFVGRHGYTANQQKMTSYVVMMYNRQLSDSEINQIYLAYASRFGW